MGRSQVALHFSVRFRVYFTGSGNSTSSEFCAILPSSSCGITQDQANLRLLLRDADQAIINCELDLEPQRG